MAISGGFHRNSYFQRKHTFLSMRCRTVVFCNVARCTFFIVGKGRSCIFSEFKNVFLYVFIKIIKQIFHGDPNENLAKSKDKKACESLNMCPRFEYHKIVIKSFKATYNIILYFVYALSLSLIHRLFTSSFLSLLSS